MSALVPVTSWSYVANPAGGHAVDFTKPSAVPSAAGATVSPDAGTIYSFVYRAKDPKVMGIGFAAVRDLIAFLKSADKDASNNPNPLNDTKTAGCFMHDFLHQGFNKSANGSKVFGRHDDGAACASKPRPEMPSPLSHSWQCRRRPHAAATSAYPTTMPAVHRRLACRRSSTPPARYPHRQLLRAVCLLV